MRYALLALSLPMAFGLIACDNGGESHGSDSGQDVTAPDADTADVDVDTPDASDASDVADAGGTDDRLTWGEPVGFELEPGLLEAHPDAFARISGWGTYIPPGPRPKTGELGAFGTGNGHVFALFGYGSPANTLHTMAGPTYEKHDGFFGDYGIRLTRDGELLSTAEEWAGRALSGPQVMTRLRSEELLLDTVDFAPWTEGPERFCIVRFVVVRNAGDAAVSGVGVRISASGFADADGDALVERREARTLVTRATLQAEATSRRLDVGIGALEPGGRSSFTLTHCAGPGSDAPLPLTGDPGEWLDETADAYRTWESDLADFTLADRMLDDFVEGQKLTQITQTAETGATCPMSQYTRTWARDNIGPVLAWHAYGAFEEAHATMDYIYGAVLLGGDFSNSYNADLDLSALPAPPDWEAMPPLSDRVAAETPSYMVWIYGAHANATGDTDIVSERWGYLRRALLAQAFSELDLLPFTDDETYRAAMNAAFGLALEYPHAERNDSANSSFLWLGAARHMLALAERLGLDDDAAEIRARFEEVEEATLDTFHLDDGCFAAFRERASGELSPPFEDVGLTVTWAGWLNGDSELAAGNLACMIDRLGVESGVIRSYLAEQYRGLAAAGGGDGILTGMLPGYALAALTDGGHPDAEASLAAMGRFASSSGNFQEYIDATNETGLSLVYDASGAIGDYTAKYRPWEGGINVHAVLDYLFGARVDAFSGRITLRPHLPSGWPAMRADRLRIGDDRYDVHVTRIEGGTEVLVRSHAASALEVIIRWDTRTPGLVARIGDDEMPTEALVVREHFGAYSFELPATPLDAGGELRFSFIHTGE